MGSYDFWFILSMFLLIATLVVKIFSVASLTNLKKELHLIEQRRENRRKELHKAKNQKNVLNANLSIMKKKKDGLRNRLTVMENEMEKIEKEEKKREERYSPNQVKR